LIFTKNHVRRTVVRLTNMYHSVPSNASVIGNYLEALCNKINCPIFKYRSSIDV